MNAFDLRFESDLLEKEFGEVLSSLGFHAEEISTGLARRIGLRTASHEKWTEQFSPLTALYPLVQSEGLRGVSHDVARRATLGHLCLLTHTFVEDRHFDGQIRPSQLEVLLAKSLLLEGWEILHQVAGADSVFKQKARALLATYAQNHADDAINSDGHSLSDAYVESVGSGRASYGLLAPLALAYASNADNEAPQHVKQAFDALATALQWADDIEDWPADLDAGDRNFLLATQRLRGTNPYALPEDIGRRAKVGEALIGHGVLADALTQARKWVSIAARCQEAMGCRQLVAMIHENFGLLDGAEARFKMKLEKANHTAIANP